MAIGSLVLAGLAVGVPVARAGGLSAWVMRTLAPKEPFAASVAPAPPDYASPEAWSALPERDDLADRVPPGMVATSPAAARVAVFYLHPTASVAPVWNAPADDVKLAVATDRGGVLIQASAFNAVGVVHAPRYRQATGAAYYTPSPDGERAIEIAYSDIDRAFDAFLARRTAGRPFLLAGHSQGAVLAARLLARRVAGTPLREELVAPTPPRAPASRTPPASTAPCGCSSPAASLATSRAASSTR